MSRIARPVAALVLASLAGLASPASSSAAEGWDDAKAAFKKALAAEDPMLRKTAFAQLLGFDGADAVDEIVAVVGREQDPAVLLAGVKALGRFSSPAAMNALTAATKAAKGPKHGLLLLAMRESASDVGKEHLLELLSASDPQDAASAALALGRRRIGDAIPKLLALLSHKDGLVRSAAARGLASLASSIPKEGRARLADALETGTGRERADLVDVLKAATGRDFGYDP